MTDREATAAVQDIVRGSGSSFYWAMRLLPKDQREAMFAIYAFCRDLDDIADGPRPTEAKRAALDAWRAEIAALYDGRPTHPIARALAEPVRRYDLERAEFEELIAGMEMDLGDGLVAPSLDTLRLYCRRVAGAVGMLAIRVFGCPQARDFAIATGEALQLTNILRDVAEDAKLGRLYLPEDVLREAGIDGRTPDAVLAAAGLARACEALARLAEKRYAEAEDALGGLDRRKVWPAVIMMTVYRSLLDDLKKRGWHRLTPRPKLGGWRLLAIAARVRSTGG